MRSPTRWLVAGLMLLTLWIPAVVLAVDTRTGNYLTVARGEVVDDDLFVAGRSVALDGTVNGDVVVAAQEVTVNGTVNGNLVVAAEWVEIKGTVTGTVIAAAQGVSVSGQVGRNLVGAGSRIRLGEGAVAGHSLIAAGDRVEVLGKVGRGAMLAGNAAVVEGQVGRELRAAAEQLRIGPGAAVAGPVTYWSDREADIAVGARTGVVTRRDTPKRNHYNFNRDWGSWYTQPWVIALKLGGFIVAGLAVLALLPGIRKVYPGVVLSKPWQAPLVGFLALIAYPLAAVLLMVTVVGLPLGAMLLLAYPVLIYCGQIFLAWAVGSLLADRVPAIKDMSWPVLFLIGALLTTLITEIRFIGDLAGVAAVFYGLGGLYYTLRSRLTETI